MSLQSLCMNNLVNLIKNLPPLMKDEVLGETMKSIKDEVRKDVIKEIRRSAVVVVDDVTEQLISAHKTGRGIKRNEYTKDIDDELYYTILEIAEQFVEKHAEKIVFDNHMDQRDLDDYDDESSDSS
jgi:methyl coenzyme M reductase beta subunit